MYKINSYDFLFLLFIFLLSSCKNDLKLNAPYKEIPSVYAVLNPQESVQMIRVNKVFLGEGDANVMAKVADSVNYQPGELLITLERYVSGVKSIATQTGNKYTITFGESVIETVQGAFNTTQRVYTTSDKLFTTGDYVLTITNTKTKNVFTAKTKALNSVTLSGYSPLCDPPFPVPYNPVNQGNTDVYINYAKPEKTYSIRYVPNEAILYQLTMRMHYYDSLDNGIKHYNYVDYLFPNQNKKDAVPQGNLGPFLINTFKGSDLYDAVGSSLSKNSRSLKPNEGRRVFKAEFIIYSSTQDYLDYLQFSAPSLSIAQDRPLYSNFDDKKALGIFAFRAKFSIEKEMDGEFISQFAVNHSTCPHLFYLYNPTSTKPPCNP